ncbi:MAG: GGDEF domain-containing protein [Lachnospiraceae bacterium]|nr:GGDEF domain-containing protein [Lachnospiraceae bacterium]
MNNGIDIRAVIIANTMAIMLNLLLYTGIFWRKNTRSREDKLLIRLIIVCIFTCILEPATFLLDGVPGLAAHILGFLCNTGTYATNILIGPLWSFLISEHIGYRISRRHVIISHAVAIIGASTLIVNIFYPIAFTITDENVYVRGPVYMLFLIMMLFYIADGLHIYIKVRCKSKSLRFFPLWQFLIPIAAGIAIQTFMYGVSTIWPFFSIAMAGLVLSFQNESVFRDGLTGLYNKMYLDNLKNRLTHKGSGEYIIMMLDMNHFKSINDGFGHSEGDVALKTISRILSRAIGLDGTVIRYAGDEFVILMSTNNMDLAEEKIKDIHSRLLKYNETSGKPYQLSVAIGCSSVDLKHQTIDEILCDVDQKMYEDKREFYTRHAEFDRRKN